MSTLPPLTRDQRIVDADHLKLLAAFHYVLAGLSLVGLGFLFLHWSVMNSIMNNPAAWQGQKGGPPPAEFLAIFKWFYAAGGVFMIGGGIMNLASGILIQRRRARMFSMITSGLDCLFVPFGTILGVFTLVVLLRNSVRELYGSTSATG